MGNIAKRVAAIAGGVLVIGAIASGSGNHQKQANTTPAKPATAQAIPVEPATPPHSLPVTPTPTPAPAAATPPAPSTSSGLSNTNTYTNSSGNTVHSPAYSTNDAVPEGATAKCSDGTYSFSQHRSGTCSHHGGVATWL